MSEQPPAILIEGVSKAYSRRLLRLLSGLARLWGARSGATPERAVDALRDVTLRVARGEVVGLVGHNGAGKSTLLRIITGATRPTAGRVSVQGRITAILDLSTGLVPEQTGRENIRYLGALYGVPRRLLDQRLEEIASFAGVLSSLDRPVRTYSLGMRTRLAFSVATSVEPDVLLVDEALSVGDAGFARRCRERFRSMCAGGAAALVVSHDQQALADMCDRVVWLERGCVRAEGRPEEILPAYAASRHAGLVELLRQGFDRRPGAAAVASASLRLERVDCRTAVEPTSCVRVDEPLVVEGIIDVASPLEGVTAELEVLREDDMVVLRAERQLEPLVPGRSRLLAHLGPVRLGRYTYDARLRLRAPDGGVLAAGRASFVVEDDARSVISAWVPRLQWSVATQERRT